MKRHSIFLILILYSLFSRAQYVQSMGYTYYSFPFNVNVGNGSVHANHPSASFEIDGTTQGFLPPRLTTTQRNAIVTPAPDLIILNTDTHRWNVWNGSAWVETASFLNPMTTANDIIVGGVDGVPTRFGAPGVNGYVFSWNSTTGLQWTDPAILIGSLRGSRWVSGGIITHLSGYVYNVSAATYYINDTLHSSPAKVITLAAADPTNDRIDEVVWTSGDSVDVVQGTAGNPAQEPTVDISKQLRDAFLIVSAGTTQPANLVKTIIRDEGSGGEWTISKTVTSTDNYSINPYHGTISQRITSASNGQYMQWTAPTMQSKLNFQNLIFFIRNNTALANNRNISVQLFNNSSQVGSTINLSTYGYGRTTTGSYMVVAVPVNLFGGGDAFNAVRIVFTGPNGAVDIQMDYEQFQSGLYTPAGDASTNAITTVKGNTGSYTAFAPNSGVKILGSGGVSVSVSNDTISVVGTVAAVDTGSIPNFSTKVRSLFSSTDPVTYSNGLFGLRQSLADSIRASVYSLGFTNNANGTTTLNRSKWDGSGQIDTYIRGVSIGTPSNNDLLHFNTSSGFWENFTPSYLSGTVGVSNGGTGLTSYTLGDVPYASAANTLSKLSGNTTTTKKFFTQTGTGSVSAAPAWGTIAASDVPTLNQNTTGSAATLTTSRNIYGNAFNGSADLNQVIASTYGGTGNGFTKFTGATTSEKTYTLPNASATILTDNAAVTILQGGTGATTASGARTNLGATTVGSNLFTVTNPSAIRYIQINADNSVTLNSASAQLTALGGLSNPMTSVNDLIIGGASGAPTRLAAPGTSGSVIQWSSGGGIQWVNGATWSGSVASAAIGSGSGGISAIVNVQTSTSSSSYTLPALSTNRCYLIKNAGTADLTVSRAGSDVIWTNSSVTSFTVSPGQSAFVFGGVSSWYVLFDGTNPNNLTTSSTTDNLDEGATNKYYTDTRARAAFTVGTVNSQTKSANGLVITVGGQIVQQTADHSNPGLMSSTDYDTLHMQKKIVIDKTLDSLGWKKDANTLYLKSVTVKMNDGTSFSKTITDSTITYTAPEVSAVNGGTGQSSYTVGDILWANSTTTLSKFGAGAAGQQLSTGGTGGSPSWVDPAQNFTAGAALLGSTIKYFPFGLTWSQANTSQALTSGQARAELIYINKATLITGIKFFQRIQGNYTAGANNYIALYSVSGTTLTQVAISSNDGTLWKATANTMVSVPFTASYNAAPGMYYVVALYTFVTTQTTAPSIAAASNLDGASMCAFDFTNGNKLTSFYSNTSLPPTISTSSLSTDNSRYFLMPY